MLLSLVTCKLSPLPHYILAIHNRSDDSIYAMNGKSVEVDNTDAEGRLILSGIILFRSSKSWPDTHEYTFCRCYLLYIYHLQTAYFG